MAGFAWTNTTHIYIKNLVRELIGCAHERVSCGLHEHTWHLFAQTTGSSLRDLSSSWLSSAPLLSIVKREPSGAQTWLQGSYPHQSHPEPAQYKETHRDQRRLILQRWFRNKHCPCLNWIWREEGSNNNTNVQEHLQSADTVIAQREMAGLPLCKTAS